MASTNFKLFDENKTNMMSDTEYNINTQRLNGVQAGIASSQLQNKTLHQTSLVAYSLAQIMMQNGYDANDSVAVSAFVGNMSNSLLQKVLDKATADEAKGGTNNTKYITPATMKAAVDLIIANKQDKITGAASTITSNNLSANRALISNSSGKVGASAVTSTELGYLSGATSNIQTQLNDKASKSYVGTAFANPLSGYTKLFSLEYNYFGWARGKTINSINLTNYLDFILVFNDLTIQYNISAQCYMFLADTKLTSRPATSSSQSGFFQLGSGFTAGNKLNGKTIVFTTSFSSVGTNFNSGNARNVNSVYAYFGLSFAEDNTTRFSSGSVDVYGR